MRNGEKRLRGEGRKFRVEWVEFRECARLIVLQIFEFWEFHFKFIGFMLGYEVYVEAVETDRLLCLCVAAPAKRGTKGFGDKGRCYKHLLSELGILLVLVFWRKNIRFLETK